MKICTLWFFLYYFFLFFILISFLVSLTHSWHQWFFYFIFSSLQIFFVCNLFKVNHSVHYWFICVIKLQECRVFILLYIPNILLPFFIICLIVKYLCWPRPHEFCLMCERKYYRKGICCIVWVQYAVVWRLRVQWLTLDGSFVLSFSLQPRKNHGTGKAINV